MGEEFLGLQRLVSSVHETSHINWPKAPLTTNVKVPYYLQVTPPLNNLREPPVIKLDIINEVVNKTGITKTKAELAVETVFGSMKKALAHGERIELRGFGVFNVRPRKTGIGRNPRTGAEVNIPPGKAVRFKPGKELQSID
jgi:DNA-binding protein HU-beta